MANPLEYDDAPGPALAVDGEGPPREGAAFDGALLCSADLCHLEFDQEVEDEEEDDGYARPRREDLAEEPVRARVPYPGVYVPPGALYEDM